jgi:hypothetical protein
MLAVISVYKDILESFKSMTVIVQGSTYPTLPILARWLLPVLDEKPGTCLAAAEDDGPL